MSYLVGMRKILSVAMAMVAIGSLSAAALVDRRASWTESDEAQVQAQIDARLHAVLVKMRQARYRH